MIAPLIPDLPFLTNSRKPVILVVEQEEEVRDALVRSLEREGFPVLPAENRPAADLMARSLSRHDPGIPILLMENLCTEVYSGSVADLTRK
jgi:CheY-like chemotaxis protein